MPSFPKEVALAEEPAARQSVVGFLRNVNRKSTAVTQDDLWDMIDTDKDGHISKVEFAAMYSAVKEAVLREHEESRGLRGKLERSRARVRLFGAAAGLLVLAVALLIPCLWAVIMMTKDTFVTSPAIIVAENATLTNTSSLAEKSDHLEASVLNDKAGRPLVAARADDERGVQRADDGGGERGEGDEDVPEQPQR